MATLQDVAERAGVALSTVSFVLNNNPRVSPETREVVLKAARELNYTLGRKGRPRRGERQAVTPRRKNLVAFLIPCSEPVLRMSSVYLSSVEAAETALARANKSMIIRTISADELAGSRPLPKVDGVLMILHEPAKEYPQFIAHVPSVRLMGLADAAAPWDQVTYNNDSIGTLAGRYLLERGHRRCAFLSPQAGQGGVGYPHLNVGRQDAFIQTVRSGGGTVRVNSAPLSVDNPTASQQMLRDLLLADPRPTGLFIPADEYTLTVYGLLFSIGIRPGVDLDIISCNNDMAIVRGLHPRPANIDIHTRWIGTAGVTQLLERLQSPDMPRNVRRFEPTLIPAEYPWPHP